MKMAKPAFKESPGERTAQEMKFKKVKLKAQLTVSKAQVIQERGNSPVGT